MSDWFLCHQLYYLVYLNHLSDIQDLKITKGLALGDILTEVHTIIQRGLYLLFS